MTAFPLGSPCAPGTRQELYKSLLPKTHSVALVTFSNSEMGSRGSEPCLGSPSYKEAKQGLELLSCCHWTVYSIHMAPRWNSEVCNCSMSKPNCSMSKPPNLTELWGQWCPLQWGLGQGLLSDDGRPWVLPTSQPLSGQKEVSPWVPVTKVHVTQELRSPFCSIWMQPSYQVGPTEVASLNSTPSSVSVWENEGAVS